LDDKHQTLVARLRAGNTAAANEFVDIFYEQIYLFMRRMGHSRHVSEDLTQECFLNAWRHLAQLRDDGALKSWLYHIAANVSRHYWRKHKNSELVGFETCQSADTSGSQYEDADELNKLQQAVLALPTKYREAIVLHYMQQLTIAEAAAAAQVRQGTFKSRLSRALKVLREKMKP